MALHVASLRGRAGVVALLVEKGAEVNASTHSVCPTFWLLIIVTSLFRTETYFNLLDIYDYFIHKQGIEKNDSII